MYSLVYFSTESGNTHKFVQNLGFNAVRIPLDPDADMIQVKEPFILITPTYSRAKRDGGVPKQVVRFLNDEINRNHMRGVIAGGNTNFGKFYGHAGKIIAEKCKVPFLYKFELTGTDQDIKNVKQGVAKLWDQHNTQPIRA